MKKYLYGFGSVAFALALSGMPAIVSADDGVSGWGEVNVGTNVRVQGIEASSSARADEENEKATSSENKGEGKEFGTSTERAQKEIEERASENAFENAKSFLFFALEGTTTVSLSLDDLKKSIEKRKNDLDDEEASTSPENKDIEKNVNPVRLAVHALLASKDLLDGIGAQVSEIAKHMNDSIATTTVAEVKIKSRGFLVRLFFGGDSASADVIAKEVADNQARIDDLTKLLAQTNISADVQIVLKAQIAALQDSQTRLQALAEKEQSAWGLFSWRF